MALSGERGSVVGSNRTKSQDRGKSSKEQRGSRIRRGSRVRRDKRVGDGQVRTRGWTLMIVGIGASHVYLVLTIAPTLLD